MVTDKVKYEVNVQTLKVINTFLGNADKDQDKDNRGNLKRDAVNITVSPQRQLVIVLASNGFTVYKMEIPFERFFADYNTLFQTLQDDFYLDITLESLKFGAKSYEVYFDLEFRKMKDNLNERFILLLNNALNSDAETYFNVYNPLMLANVFKGLKTLKIKSAKITKRKSQLFIHAETDDKIRLSFAVCAMYNPREPVKEPYEF